MVSLNVCCTIPKAWVGDDQRQVVKQPVIDLRRRTRNQAQDRTGGEERRKHRKKKIKSKLRGMAEDSVVHDRLPGASDHHPARDALQIPQRPQRGVGHEFPDAPVIAVQSEIDIGSRG